MGWKERRGDIYSNKTIAGDGKKIRKRLETRSYTLRERKERESNCRSYYKP